MSWGIAEEAANATVWLTRYGLPGAQLLSELLQLNDQVTSAELSPVTLTGDWAAPCGRLCPLMAGVALSDCAQLLKTGDSIQMKDVTHPLMLLPFAASAAVILEKAVCLEWGNVVVATTGNLLQITGNSEELLLQCTSCVTSSVVSMQGGQKPMTLRAEISTDLWTVLSDFAQRTYAPATENSRLLGAGSGLNDND